MKSIFKFVLSVACASLIVGCAHSHQQEPADISYHFQGMPLDQVLDLYKGLAGKNVIVGNKVNHHATLNVVTATKLTRTEAMKLLESAMRQQAAVTIIHKSNGSLIAVPLVDSPTIF